MKKVSIEIAKILKDAGYPLTYNEIEYEEPWGGINSYIDYNNPNLPAYMDVWIWLWSDKKIHIEIFDSKITTQCYATINGQTDTVLFNSPEEAIEQAIEYLVNNNLIK